MLSPAWCRMPNWLLHWSHGGNTGIALLVVAGLGVAAGLDIRRRRLEGKTASGEPEVIDHGTAMVFALLIALVGASGGLASMGFDRQPLLESPHAWAAIVSVVLLVGNGLLSTSFAGRRPAAASGPSPRDLPPPGWPPLQRVQCWGSALAPPTRPWRART
mmetsp:Transcript_4521/g.17185  ORF Transcript_4521/g.17185 Transcript_4521/m.17185 type:complete len:160 (-) Transcript_4521:93-572(-)